MTDDGRKPPRDLRRRVVCAAIRAADGELLLGIRHYSPDMNRQIEARADGDKFRKRGDDDQGFVDQWGEWLSREEAYHVAAENGQIVRPFVTRPKPDGTGARLYSEGLY